MRYINKDAMDAVSSDAFVKTYPFPWANLKNMILPELFVLLTKEFPPIDKFEYHKNLPRQFGQRPHNRYYASFGENRYKAMGEGGCELQPQDLSENWMAFIQEVLTDPAYHQWVGKLFGTADWKIRLAWHVGSKGSEVSPHVDESKKIGTHIFYFNTREDWQEEWGGELLILGEKVTDKMNPEIEDFLAVTPCRITDNRSVIFKNTDNAWHGVKPLVSPEGKYRRLFNVIFERI